MTIIEKISVIQGQVNSTESNLHVLFYDKAEAVKIANHFRNEGYGCGVTTVPDGAEWFYKLEIIKQ